MIEFGQDLRLQAQPRYTMLRQFVPFALAILDVSLIFAAFITAYWVRYTLRIGPIIREHVPLTDYWPVALLLVAIMIPTLLVKGAYARRFRWEIVDEVSTVISATTITIASVVVITAMLHRYDYSRGVILYVWVLVIVAVTVGRSVFRALQSSWHKRGMATRRLLVVGASDAGKMIMQWVTNRPDWGYQLVGFVEHRDSVTPLNFGRFRAVGRIDDIPSLIEGRHVDDVIIALPAAAHAEVWPILTLCEKHHVGVKLVPDLFELSLSRVRVDHLAGIPLLDVQEQHLQSLGRSVKRGIDIAVALVVCVLGLPLMAILAALIWIESHGSPFFSQERIGLNGRPFGCWKLRTMRLDADEMRVTLLSLNEARGPLFKIRDDPRCTRIGRRVRRWSLDEVPQIWNVLKGEMSLVGPRPPLPSEVEEYEPQHMRRLAVKPGMTGLWQVSGRSHLPFDEMVVMDEYYIQNWSLALDIRILVQTISAVLGRRGAY